MIHSLATIKSSQYLTSNVCVLGIESREIASVTKPGQFVNIKVSDFSVPLLRRPFSIYHVSDGEIKIIFNIIGTGTSILSQKKIGDTIDIIGPLGSSFKIDDNYELAILVGGGMGVAILPTLTSAIKNIPRKFITYLGARTSTQLITNYLENLNIATDDGSVGYHGTVIELLKSDLIKKKFSKPKIFACGPNEMFESIALLTKEFGIPCEVSLESVMACGIGICQGCPVEVINGEKKYALVCKDGPVFDLQTIRITSDG